MNTLIIKEKITQYLKEDIHYGDLSSQIFGNQMGQMKILCKDEGIFCGAELIKIGFNILSESDVEVIVEDGDHVQHGQTIALVKGRVQDLLQAERTVLNLIQRMSGIATITNQYVALTEGTNAVVTDTRKTTPGLGIFEKYAVRTGGGTNHRRTLNDGIMLKDNHIGFMGSIEEAVMKVSAYKGHMDKIEVEIENKEMLEAAIKANVDVIMFDNCTPEFIQKHLPLVPEHIVTEASGGINLKTIRSYAKTGVDVISVGALFYNTKALDISAEVHYDHN